MSRKLEEAVYATFRRITSAAWADDLFHQPPPVGVEFDSLAEYVPPEKWGPARHGLRNALGRIEPRHKLAVLGMASNEAPYLAEWIAHHLAVGAEKIFVYTNNNTDGTDELLRWFARNAPVTVIPVACAPGVNVQQKNYNHALFLLPELRLYEWVAVLDVDEFLLPDARHGHNLRSLLAAAPEDTEALLFPWHWRGWPREFARGPGLLAERFGHAVPNFHTKCVTRLRHVTSLRQVHFPEFDRKAVMRDGAFDVVEQVHGWHMRQRSGAGGWVEHFWGKSFEEFLIKQRRGEEMALSTEHFHRRTESFFVSPPEIAENAAPWPEAMLRATKARLAGFAARPGFVPLQQMIEARYAEYAARTRADAELRNLFETMLRRFPG